MLIVASVNAIFFRVTLFGITLTEAGWLGDSFTYIDGYLSVDLLKRDAHQQGPKLRRATVRGRERKRTREGERERDRQTDTEDGKSSSVWSLVCCPSPTSLDLSLTPDL